MTKVTCTRIIEFDSAHRVIGHENKCKFLHGHRYVLEVKAEADALDNLGRVADFGELKTIIKTWIDEYLDHNVILSVEDRTLGKDIENTTKQKIYYLTTNPTAENIALHLLNDIIPKLLAGKPFTVNKLKLYETPNCYVTVKK